MSALVIHTPKKSLIRMLFGSAAFVALGIGMLFLPAKEADLESYFIAYAGIPFFGLCSFFALSRLLSIKPTVVIDEVGLLDNASAVNAGLIPWSDIRAVCVSSFLKQGFLAVYVDDPEKYLARANPVKRVLMRANQFLVGTAIAIPLTVLSVSSEEFLSEVGKYLRSDAIDG